MNLALRLASGQLRGTSVVSLQSSVDSLQSWLGDDVSDTTRATIAKATDAPKMAALTLGSPEFQRRGQMADAVPHESF